MKVRLYWAMPYGTPNHTVSPSIITYSRRLCMNYKIMGVHSHEQLVEIVGVLETLSDKGGKDFIHYGQSGTYTILHYSGMTVVLVW